jgi:hypothetical protein
LASYPYDNSYLEKIKPKIPTILPTLYTFLWITFFNNQNILYLLGFDIKTIILDDNSSLRFKSSLSISQWNPLHKAAERERANGLQPTPGTTTRESSFGKSENA